jgi:hypothetical protein
MECSTDFSAQRGHRKLRTTYLKELARVDVTVRMLLSVVFLQQAPLNKMRTIFLKTYALLISLHDSWEIIEMTQYS